MGAGARSSRAGCAIQSDSRGNLERYALYGLDNGVDTFGDDEQPEELNRIEPGKKYGWPYILGNGMKHPLREPKSGTLDDWDKSSVRPVLTYTAHAASMQLLFADRTTLPAEYRGDAFATMHGSWNCKPPSGYEVVRIRFENGQPRSIEPFVSGFLLKGAMENGVASRGPSALPLRPMGACY